MKEKIYRAIRYIFKGIPNVIINKKIIEIEKSECLSNKKILITGANRGIGLAIAQKCAAHGAYVYLLGRSKAQLIEAQKVVGDNCDICIADLSKSEEIKRITEYIDNNNINVLVNNAGISLHEKNSFVVTGEGFDQQFQLNLKAPYFLSIEFAKIIKEKSIQGSILNIVSERGLYCDDLPYGLTKAALISFTRGFSRRVLCDGIRVNAIAPGVTATDMTGYSEDDNLYNEYLCGKRTFLASEIAETAVFLISDTTDCISGEVVACNQGNHMRCDW